MNNLLIGTDELGVLRDRGRRAGRPAHRRGHERRAHPHDQHPQHADRGARAGVPAAGAAAPPAAGQRRCRCPRRRRGHRARHRGARAGRAVAHHRAAAFRSRGALDGGEPGAVGENWLLPGGDEAGRSACRTSAPSHWRPATSSGCSRPAVAAGASSRRVRPTRPDRLPGLRHEARPATPQVAGRSSFTADGTAPTSAGKASRCAAPHVVGDSSRESTIATCHTLVP